MHPDWGDTETVMKTDTSDGFVQLPWVVIGSMWASARIAMIGLKGATAAAAGTGTGYFVVGKHPYYTDYARRTGSTLFSIPKAAWDGLGTDEARWLVNKAAIDRAVTAGYTLILMLGPRSDNAVTSGSWLHKELIYLWVRYGLTPNNDFTRIVPFK
jgi:hypothetical protein